MKKNKLKDYRHYAPLIFIIVVEVILLILLKINYPVPKWSSAVVEAGMAFAFLYTFSVEAKRQIGKGKPNTALRLMFVAGALFYAFMVKALHAIILEGVFK